MYNFKLEKWIRLCIDDPGHGTNTKCLLRYAGKYQLCRDFTIPHVYMQNPIICIPEKNITYLVVGTGRHVYTSSYYPPLYNLLLRSSLLKSHSRKRGKINKKEKRESYLMIWLRSECINTFEMWTPRLRWTPEHSMHTRTPRFNEAQSGSEAQQSAQLSFPHTFLSKSIGFSCLEFILCCCEPLRGRSRCPLPQLFSSVSSSIAEWSRSDELPNELLSLQA